MIENPAGDGRSPRERVRPDDPRRRSKAFQARRAEAGPGQGFQRPAGQDHLPENKKADEIEADDVRVMFPDDPAEMFDPAVLVFLPGRTDELNPFLAGRLPPVRDRGQVRPFLKLLGILKNRENDVQGDAVGPGAGPEDRIGQKGFPDKRGVDPQLLPFREETVEAAPVLVDLHADDRPGRVHFPLPGGRRTGPETNERYQ
ncbi:MAG: hypothetical protein BWX98_02451 [Candidatus Aminicenantes bacterium ADurb.Bin147]|nr:MAG: hypothetical protein BWX98_02451 [Candidatus Aminicenantes bacterium ADurb.Bin147]